MTKKNKNKANDIQQTYIEASAGEDETSTMHPDQHPGFVSIFLFIEGDIRDVRNICLN